MNRFDDSRRAALKALAFAGVAALAVACAAPTAVRHDQDPAVDLHSYQTFAFYDEPAFGPSSLIGRHLMQATREQMERQHYTYSERDPDLRVALLLLVREHPELRSTPGRGPYGHRGLGAGVESTRVRDGTLRIDLVDTRRNALVWQGVAEGRVDAEAMRNPGQAVRDVVAEIFARFGQTTR
jgi:hypothetical protein